VSGAAPAEPPVFEETDGLVAVEVESHPPADQWHAETEMEGFTGGGYYTWRGGNLYRRPGKGALAYRIRIFQPGRYQLRIRNRHDLPNSTDANDCWVKMDAGKWIKAYSGTRGRWTWATNLEHIDHRRDDRGGFTEQILKERASFELDAGMHVFQIAGRSRLLSIDRFHLYLEDKVGEPLDTGLPETRGIPPVPELHRLKAASAYWQAGQLGSAFAAAEAERSSADSATAAEARIVQTQLERYADLRRKKLAALKADDPIAAVDALKALADRFEGSEPAKALRETVRAWDGEPATADARTAAALLGEIRKTAVPLRAIAEVKDALGRVRALAEQYNAELRAVLQRVQQLRRKHPSAPATRRAEDLVKGLTEVPLSR